MECKKCGTALRNDAIFCTACGTLVETESAVSGDGISGPVIPQPTANEFTTIGPQPPCVSSIPPPPQMPDLPVMPVSNIPFDFPPAQQAPPYQPPQGMQAPPQQYSPQPGMQAPPQQYPPPPGMQAPPQQYPPPPGMQAPPQQYPPPPGMQAPPYSPQQYPPPPGIQAPSQPQQQYYQSMPPPYTPMPGGPKKSSTGLIVGLIAGGVFLVTLAVILGLFFGNIFNTNLNDVLDNPGLFESLSPEPARPPPPVLASPTPAPGVLNTELLGVWSRDHGSYIWFFGYADFIGFTDNGDGTYEVYESAYDEHGSWYISTGGRLIIDGEWSGIQEFTFSIEGNVLTLIDADGDSAVYAKVN